MLITNLVFSQEKKVFFLRNNDNKPVADAIIYTYGKITTFSDENGKIELNDSVKNIQCEIVNYKIFNINLSALKNNIITLDCPDILDAVTIHAKYSPSEHLKKLLQKTRKKLIQTDTTIFYKFKITRTFDNIEFKEYLSGLVKVVFKNNRPKVFYYSIDSFYTNIPDSIFMVNNIKRSLKTAILYKKNAIKFYIKKDKRVSKVPTQKDELIFKISYKKSSKSSIEHFIYYTNNRISKMKLFYSKDKNFIKEFFNKHKKKSYLFYNSLFLVKYSKNDILFPTYIHSDRLFIYNKNTGSFKGKYTLDLTKISITNTIDKELPQVHTFFSNNKEIEFLKKNYKYVINTILSNK